MIALIPDNPNEEIKRQLLDTIEELLDPIDIVDLCQLTFAARISGRLYVVSIRGDDE